MSLLIWIIIFSLLGGLVSVLAAASILLLKESLRKRVMPHLISFAIGALLGAAFLGLLPHALEGAQREEFHDIMFTVLVGLLSFFMLEKLVLWRHCHSTTCEAHSGADEHDHDPQAQSASVLILVGDGLHNFVDGVLIAAAFMTDLHLGIVTALAVIAHEIPQELGDFVVLLQGGFSRKKALLYNVLSTMATVVGAVGAYFFLQGLERFLPYVLAVAAASFIYVAVADLIPGLHKRSQLAASLQQLLLIASGVAVIYLSHTTMH